MVFSGISWLEKEVLNFVQRLNMSFPTKKLIQFFKMSFPSAVQEQGTLLYMMPSVERLPDF